MRYYHNGEVGETPAIQPDPYDPNKHFVDVPPLLQRMVGTRVPAQPGSAIVALPEVGFYVCPVKDPNNKNMPGSVDIPDFVKPSVVKGLAPQLLTETEAAKAGLIKRVEIAAPDAKGK